MVALFTKAIQDLIPNKADDWGVRIVSVGKRDVRRLLSTSRDLQGDDTIDFKVVFTNTNICEIDDELDEDCLRDLYQAALVVLNGLLKTAMSGELISAIFELAKAAGLYDLLSELILDNVETQGPQTEVVDSSPFPSSSPSLSALPSEQPSYSPSVQPSFSPTHRPSFSPSAKVSTEDTVVQTTMPRYDILCPGVDILCPGVYYQINGHG